MPIHRFKPCPEMRPLEFEVLLLNPPQGRMTICFEIFWLLLSLLGFPSPLSLLITFCAFSSSMFQTTSPIQELQTISQLSRRKWPCSGCQSLPSVAAFSDTRLKYFSRTVTRNAPLKIRLKSIIDIPMLTQMVQVCDSMYMGCVFKAAILLSFFSFLRLSNLVPHSMSTFQPLKHLARGDIFFAPPGAHVLLKWSKTLQMNNSVRLLKIPKLGSALICPVTALKNLLTFTPEGKNKPLFQIKFRHNGSHYQILG